MLADRPKIMIVIEGGIVQSVLASTMMDIVIVDYDNIRAYKEDVESEFIDVEDIDIDGDVIVTTPDKIVPSFYENFDTKNMTESEETVFQVLEKYQL